MSNTILLKGRGHRVEKVAGGTITPGMLVNRTSTDTLVAHATAAGVATKTFAVENDLIGNSITDNYVVNDYVQAETLYSGCEVLAFLVAGGTAVVEGDFLESAGDGSLRKYVAGYPIAQVLTALDNSGGASMARIPVVLL